MAKSKGSKNDSSDRENWKKIFNNLVFMLKNQQSQIVSLVKDRKFLEDRIKLQYDRWNSDVNLFQDQIAQMKRELSIHEMESIVDSAKAELFLGFKLRQAVVYKKKFENAESDLSDFREWFDCLSGQCSAEKNASTSANHVELKRLKSENEKLKAEKDSEVSALLSEKAFVWNQYNKIEKDFNERHNAKQDEVKSLNDKIHGLMFRLEELQSSDTVKDTKIATLRAEISTLESESVQKDTEISRLSKEVEMLKKSRNTSGTPLLKRCTRGSVVDSQVNGNADAISRRTVTIKTESGPSDGGNKARRSSRRRKAGEIIDISEDTPKLFTSSFRVPKLKTPSPAPN